MKNKQQIYLEGVIMTKKNLEKILIHLKFTFFWILGVLFLSSSSIQIFYFFNQVISPLSLLFSIPPLIMSNSKENLYHLSQQEE